MRRNTNEAQHNETAIEGRGSHSTHVCLCVLPSPSPPLQDLADVSYLLSPQDLAALEQLPAMVAAGVSCFKIEGRLKGPEYVAATTAAYRAGACGAGALLVLGRCRLAACGWIAGISCRRHTHAPVG